jgi:hypothetical protein
MGLWYVIEWEVFWDKQEEHEKVFRKMIKKWKQLAPDKQFRYFNKRFHGTGKRVLVVTGINNMAEYEEFWRDIRKDKEWNKVVNEWKPSIGNSNQPFYWQEIPLE